VRDNRDPFLQRGKKPIAVNKQKKPGDKPPFLLYFFLLELRLFANPSAL
jgi:hypothetical protein